MVDRSAIGCPILVLAGEEDCSGVHDPRAVADFFRAECVMVPDCGHDLMLEPAAERAALVIDEWLQRVV